MGGLTTDIDHPKETPAARRHGVVEALRGGGLGGVLQGSVHRCYHNFLIRVPGKNKSGGGQ